MIYLLGKDPVQKDRRNLQIKNYLPTKLPPTPKEVTWYKIKPSNLWGMDGNDKWRLCTVAASAHELDCMRACESGIKTRISDARVIALATKMGALNGYVMLNKLKYWRTTGMFDTKLEAFCSVPTKDQNLIKSSIYILGACDIGIRMPLAWQGKDVWDTGSGGSYKVGSWGGRDVPALGYDVDGVYVCSWGTIYLLTWNAFYTYVDEGYGLVLKVWLAKDGKTPSGFNHAQLIADAEAI